MRRAEIIERLEKAEGADRELDADIDIGEVRSNASSHAAASPAIAMLSALFRALEAKEAPHG